MFYMCSDFSREVLGAGMLIVLFSLLLDWLTAGLIDGQNLRAEMEEQVNRLNEERIKELEYLSLIHIYSKWQGMCAGYAP